ncbi:SDR family NAD(P)-dependent oxidoreductase [Azospirillum picis]|uniref:NAD(P)-dependent dehydrogenase (Short-subunit alcohol dehydrogenase family) n=1 Tax=Azospirillum picis TaxID=488438 RepID=A0ABU0MSF1_9PROT|nr:SDR family NAD(P)-dependent oxidoreductase [Azospirillum picis]MBP2301964.1 NAD(P)-dependent dehydrogenase (short-subunit alcohol dehydrogenase family) [Azospirillum picis]MDQ0536413.1 NAD(P)-dependent dehydrogenase (short-subunit alcohol dehydrogenase family) [Azospirillum picis]
MSTPQTPIRSGFGRTSTADDVIAGIDLSGRTAVVTGGYSGLGLETVRVFLAAGARVIVPARDVERARRALASHPTAEVWPMDLLAPESIDAFAERFLAEHTPLHILVNNAGIMALPELTRDTRGHELQFATNHLGHFQLALRLWPALKSAHGARVVALSSLGHRFSRVVFEDVDFHQRTYNPFSAYGQSKTANALFAVELDRRGAPDGVRAFAVHPGGIVETNLGKHIDPTMLRDLGAVDSEGKAIIDPDRGFKTPAMGAATQVWCATSPALATEGGVYCEDCDIAVVLAPPDGDYVLGDTLGQGGVFPHAIDPAAAERLWMLSETLTGMRLPA